jgi:hypothetical protein
MFSAALWVAHASRALAMVCSRSRTFRACPESSFRRDADTRSPRRPLPDLHHAAGRGAGLGRGLGVACGLAVGVGLGVAVGVAVGVGVDGW